jgi:hypothetical protein
MRVSRQQKQAKRDTERISVTPPHPKAFQVYSGLAPLAAPVGPG